jgi:flagellar basal body-associated protein FliL
MSESKEKQPAAPRGGPGLIGMVLPALFAAGAAFGGAKFAGAGAHGGAEAATTEHAEVPKPPGPTLALEPFLLSVTDVNKKSHPMKVTIAIEFDGAEPKGEKEDDSLKGLTPRIRDAALGFLRTVTYEEAIDAAGGSKMRTEMLERLRSAGATKAEHILITDLVIQ